MSRSRPLVVFLGVVLMIAGTLAWVLERRASRPVRWESRLQRCFLDAHQCRVEQDGVETVVLTSKDVLARIAGRIDVAHVNYHVPANVACGNSCLHVSCDGPSGIDRFIVVSSTILPGDGATILVHEENRTVEIKLRDDVAELIAEAAGMTFPE